MNPGFYRNMPKDVYLSDPCEQPSLSSSIASLLLQECPASAWCAHPRGGNHRKDPTAAMVNGTLFDSIMLGGDTDIVCLPEELPDAKGKLVPTNDAFRLESARSWAAEQRAAGRQLVKRSELEHARTAARYILENLHAAGIELDGENQVSAIWRPGGSIWARARFDHLKLSDGVVYDLKTIDCAHPDAVAAAIPRRGYDIQEAAYTEAIEMLEPCLVGRVHFRFLFVETEPPYNVLVRPTSGAMKALGRWKWGRACATWARCLSTGEWPAYVGNDVLEPPMYELAKMEAANAI